VHLTLDLQSVCSKDTVCALLDSVQLHDMPGLKKVSLKLSPSTIEDQHVWDTAYQKFKEYPLFFHFPKSQKNVLHPLFSRWSSELEGLTLFWRASVFLTIPALYNATPFMQDSHFSSLDSPGTANSTLYCLLCLVYMRILVSTYTAYVHRGIFWYDDSQ
jgi:hypothetical protein